MPPLEGPKAKKADRKRHYTDRARAGLRGWMTQISSRDEGGIAVDASGAALSDNPTF
jgi:hypothetical protein